MNEQLRTVKMWRWPDTEVEVDVSDGYGRKSARLRGYRHITRASCRRIQRLVYYHQLVGDDVRVSWISLDDPDVASVHFDIVGRLS